MTLSLSKTCLEEYYSLKGEAKDISQRTNASLNSSTPTVG